MRRFFFFGHAFPTPPRVRRTRPSRPHMLASDSAASKALAHASYGAWKLTRSTGKAAWIAVTTFLVLAVPLIIELDREAQLVEFENQQLGALTAKEG